VGFRKQLFGRPAGTREEACEAHGRGHRKLSRSASTDTPTQPGVVSSGRFKPLEAVFAAKFGYAAAQPRQFRPHTAFQIVQHRAVPAPQEDWRSPPSCGRGVGQG
jgi:hypothetical protein